MELDVCATQAARGTSITPQVKFTIGGDPVNFPWETWNCALFDPNGVVVQKVMQSNDNFGGLSIPAGAPLGNYRVEATYDTISYQGVITSSKVVEVVKINATGRSGVGGK